MPIFCCWEDGAGREATATTGRPATGWPLLETEGGSAASVVYERLRVCDDLQIGSVIASGLILACGGWVGTSVNGEVVGE